MDVVVVVWEDVDVVGGCGGFFFPLLLFVVAVDLVGDGDGEWMW